MPCAVGYISEDPIVAGIFDVGTTSVTVVLNVAANCVPSGEITLASHVKVYSFDDNGSSQYHVGVVELLAGNR